MQLTLLEIKRQQWGEFQGIVDAAREVANTIPAAITQDLKRIEGNLE